MLIRLLAHDLAKVKRRPHQYCADHDTVQSIIMDVCDSLEEHAEFRISGFGQDRWPVDARTDLAVFLEQLPTFFINVRDAHEGEIYFYEQGLERKLRFELKEPVFIVTCESFSGWVPTPPVEVISADELNMMFENVRECFLESVRMTCPTVLNHPWLKLWASQSRQ